MSVSSDVLKKAIWGENFCSLVLMAFSNNRNEHSYHVSDFHRPFLQCSDSPLDSELVCHTEYFRKRSSPFLQLSIIFNRGILQIRKGVRQIPQNFRIWLYFCIKRIELWSVLTKKCVNLHKLCANLCAWKKKVETFHVLLGYMGENLKKKEKIQTSRGSQEPLVGFSKFHPPVRSKGMRSVRDTHGGGWSRNINARYLHTLMVYL